MEITFRNSKMSSRKTKMSSRKTKKMAKKRAQRANSNVFDQAQIQEFNEAFNLIDQNRDGFIDKEDLHVLLASLGKLLFMSRIGVS